MYGQRFRVPRKYIARSSSAPMTVLLYAYVLVSLVFLLPVRNVYTVVQPALVTLFFVTSQVLSNESPFF
jgi:hypothetical protein